MKQIPDIESRIDKALDSLDGIQRAKPLPYLFTRLKARLAKEEKNTWSGIAGIISRPVYALTIVFVVLFINAWIIVNVKVDPNAGTAANNLQSTIDQLPDEYNVAIATFYDYETP